MELIRNFGLFWYRDEVDWNPGRGRPRELVGHIGRRRPAVRVADVWNQRGLYILYAPVGPYYVGIATERSIGVRIAEHLSDEHGREWDRFSWFGFREQGKDADGIERPVPASDFDDDDQLRANAVVRDMEALLIRAMGVRNKSRMSFQRAQEWQQPWHHELESLTSKVRPDE